MAQEVQKTPLKAATVPKPGPSPKGIPQPTILGKEPPRPKEDSEENPAEATIQDYSARGEDEAKKKEAPKSSASRPDAKPAATAAASAPEEADPDASFNKDIEARLSREIEARLRKELEPRIAREIEVKLLRQFDSQLQKVVNDSVERAIKRHSQPNIPTVSREEIAAMKQGQAPLAAPKNPTPMMFKALGGAPEAEKPARLLTPGNIPIAKHPSQSAMPKAATPAALAVTRPSSGSLPRAATPTAVQVAPAPIASPAIESPKEPAPPQGAILVAQGLQLSASPTTPVISAPEPMPSGATPGAWVQDPVQQKAFQTQQIRVSKARVSLDDVSPERLIGPSPEDLGKEFLKDAGVSRSGKIAVLVLLLCALTGGSAFGIYYVYGRQVPNPPRVKVIHAAIAGIDRGTVRFPEGGPDVAIVYQPPTMLLTQGKGKRPATVVAPKPAPKATPAPKVEPPKVVTPPKNEPPRLKVVPRDGQ